MLKQEYIKLPRNIASKIIINNDQGLISFYVGLKTYAIGGCITDYKNQIKSIAKFMNCSERTTKDYIKKLVKENLAWIWGINLRLAAKDEVGKRYGIEGRRYDEYKFESFSKLKDELRKRAIADNLLMQHYKEQSKLNEEIKNLKLVNAESKRIRKVRNAVNKESFNGIDENAKISEKGIAKIYGSSWGTTGRYWKIKLAKNKMIEVKKREPILVFKNVSKEFYWKTVNANPEYPLLYNKGNVFKPQCSLINIL